ncbi:MULTISPECIES: SDR family oxidoreductase [Streptosporangium]|uniref:NAD(P)-dependent dehydrogenase (Short-subunit alcohol dehydrogenase family) n=1 Tax=Streptosporangium brasiliense TaxID=47480 RepID=A0ABT9RKF8_9ACTN|nr:SDR family oxidoreductase [Streptosporangium brasiliense]MDP9869784.1 NAD(P)-dependent dehydrogenase (short-subunit alcohol dehydrogenase family) [Streptosporangium brasiliense]
MDLQGCTALVTGANRGLGRAFALALLERGARTVYAGARDPGSVTDRDLVPVELDVTDPASVAAAAQRCGDVTLLINNAGIGLRSGLIAAPSLEAARAEMETNFFGALAMCRAFAPVLGRNGGGAIVNMLSVLSWATLPAVASYAVSKAAAWSMTNGIRLELRGQGTLVVGVHAAFIDTDMAAGITLPKTAPAEVAAQALDAVEKGHHEVLADRITRQTKDGLSSADFGLPAV